MQPYTIAGSSIGLRKDMKPFLEPDQAFPVLENAYVYRERVTKREGLRFLGRLRRVLPGANFGVTGASPWSFNVYSQIIPAITGEPNATVEAVSFTLDPLGSPIIIFDNGTGILTGSVGGNYGTINYETGNVVLVHTVGAGVLVFGQLNYYPSFPVMGIRPRELATTNDEETVFFDQRYAYKFNPSGGGFEEYITTPPNTWAGSDSNFFWSTNYRGSTPQSRLFFVTNFVPDANNPIRYTDGATWTDFAPAVDSINFLFQARILIPYYGRLLALNTWEGATVGTSVNIYNRCRFSQIGDPTAVDAWRSDQFGKGGFLDAPTNEAIISASFFKNTLIVFFERTTWQLRYVGEYGLPFIWERISSDFGSESTFSTILFDQGVTTVGDRAIIASNSINVDRIDLQIPDTVFDFRNSSDGLQRVHGVRNFQRELVYWCYNDFNFSVTTDTQIQYFPNKVLVYNYRNNTYAIFRDNVTVLGTFQIATSVTWDNLQVLWDDEGVFWTDVQTQGLFPNIVSGNQEGYVHYYADQTPDAPSLDIKAIDLTASPIQLTIINHNLVDDEIIYITGLSFINTTGFPGVPATIASTNLNNQTYLVQYIDNNTISILKWDTTLNPHQYVSNFSFTPVPSPNIVYEGKGQAALFPKLDVQTKDFNPYMQKGGQLKLSYIDFLMDSSISSAMTVNLYINTYPGNPIVRTNMIVGNTNSSTSLTAPYYAPLSDIAWHRLYATIAGQFIRIQLTFDDDLMNLLTTHEQNWVLNAITLWTRPGGKMVF